MLTKLSFSSKKVFNRCLMLTPFTRILKFFCQYKAPGVYVLACHYSDHFPHFAHNFHFEITSFRPQYSQLMRVHPNGIEKRPFDLT